VLFSGEFGYYWSSTVNGISALSLGFYSGTVGVSYDARADGSSVRCVADL
jgi:hypothetical protein